MDTAKGFLVLFCIIVLFFWQNAEATIYAYDKTNETDVFDDQTSSFGPGIGDDGIVGILVRAEPYDACSSVVPPPFTPNIQQNITILQFALVVRGGCDFGIKVFNAQKAGYRAVIVHNVGSDALVRMGSDQPSITNQIYIPSVFIGESSAIILNSSYLYQDGGRPYIQIYEGQFNPLDYYLIPFIIVIAVCFVSLLCFLLIKCLRDRRRARRGRLSLQRLKKLPVKKFVKGDEYDVCAICLDDYEEGDSLRILPCSHAYHCKCVDPWLTSNKRVCPLCKRRVLSDDESSASSDDGGDDSSDDERTPLAPSSVAASPNAPRYGTGFANRNPFRSRRIRLRQQSSSSDDTTSTDVSDTDPIERRSPPRKTNTQLDRTDAPQTSGLQLQQTSRTQDPEPEILHAMGITSTDPDVYLDSAEAMMTGVNNRVSESSIAVLSDVETLESTPDPHSYSSQDFHSLDESMTVAQTPFNLDSRRSAMPDSDHDDIVVITNGSTTRTYGDDSEV